MTNKYNLGDRVDSFTYWGKVVKSYLGPASEEYQKASQGRAGEQWHLEIRPLSPVQYHPGGEDAGGTHMRSANMPQPGRGVAAGSPLALRLDEFAKFGFTFQTEEDFGRLEGHIFYFKEEKRPWATSRNKGEILDAWPVSMNDEFKPGPDVQILPPRDANGQQGGNMGQPTGNPFQLAAELIDGKTITPGFAVPLIVGSGNPVITNNQEIMSAVQRGNAIVELLEEKGFIAVKNNKVSLVKAGEPVESEA